MGLFSKSKDRMSFKDRLKLAIQTKDPDPSQLESTVKERRRQPQPVLFYTNGSRSRVSRSIPGDRTSGSVEVSPVYDLAEVIKLQDIESYFSTSVDRHVELIMKDGYYLEGQNPDSIKYVKRRLDEIGWISNQPFSEVLRELVRNCVSTANGYLVLKRDPTRSTGRRIKLWGKELDPISAAYLPDPSAVTCFQNKTGHITKWIQKINGEEKSWPYTDVVHIPIRKKSSFVYGTPYVIPVLEDIKALRKLEMLSEHVAHKFAFPLMHWKVGTEERPAELIVDPSTNETMPETVAAENIAKIMAQEGFACTSERHEIKFLGVDGQVLDIEPFIKHYEMRVLGGLRLSEIDLGRGDTANRGTAKVIFQTLVDACREIQEAVRTALNNRLINMLLLEGGFDIGGDDQVFINFPPIDKEEERAQETHGLLLYQGGAISQAELRQEYLGRNPMTTEQIGDTFLKNWLEPLAKAKPPTTSSGSAKDKAVVSNQYGSKVKPKISANDEILQIWEGAADLINKAISSRKDARVAISHVIKQINDRLEPPIYQAWTDGMKRAYADLGKSFPVVLDKSQFTRFLNHTRARDIGYVGKVAMSCSGINPATGLELEEGKASNSRTMAALSASKILLESKLSRAEDTATKLGYIYAARMLDISKITCEYDTGDVEQFDTQDPSLQGLASNPNVSVQNFSIKGGQNE